jgi:hypothetical protein
MVLPRLPRGIKIQEETVDQIVRGKYQFDEHHFPVVTMEKGRKEVPAPSDPREQT